mmetsp:Transcript_15535/g.22145  ORF Transcript_15535/g.22145 Transcript_15535/m.22145 type:complete len:404 (-) Transcript_15535:80-1291(-)
MHIRTALRTLCVHAAGNARLSSMSHKKSPDKINTTSNLIEHIMVDEKIITSVPVEFTTFQGFVPFPAVPPSCCGGGILDSEVTCNDVLSGRGGSINNHEGNTKFRNLIELHKTKYCDEQAKRVEKQFMAARVVAIVRNLNPPGRFLKKNEKGYWEEIGDDRAREKARQSLRDENKRQCPGGKQKQLALHQPSFGKLQQLSNAAMMPLLKEETKQKISDSSPTAPERFDLQLPNLISYPSMSTIDMENTSSCSGSIPDLTELSRNTTSLSIISPTDANAHLTFELTDQDIQALLGNNVSSDSNALPYNEESAGISESYVDLISDLDVDIGLFHRSDSQEREFSLTSFWRHSSSTTDGLITVLSRLCSDVSIASQMSLDAINLIKAQTFDHGVPRNYKNLVFGGL